MKRRSVKRFLCAALAAAVMLSAAGCSSSESSDTAETEEAEDTAEEEEDAEEEEEEEEEEELSLEFGETKVTEMSVSLDGETISVTSYEARYMENYSIDDQYISIYVPEGADEDSPIFFLVNNSGWQANSYSSRTHVQEDKEYVSDSDTDHVGAALARGFVIVSYGARSRNNGEIDGVYDGHTPSTIVDTKAAIRYLRYLDANGELPAGDVDRIIVNGTSGGGALTTIIAASGNSADYYEYLYEIGACGIGVDEDGNYYSEEGIGDDIWMAVAYCPINDLGNADAAYEYTYSDTRRYVVENNGITYEDADGDITEEVLAYSEAMGESYVEFVESLGLTLEDGETLLTGENLEECVIALLNEELKITYETEGLDYILADLASEDGAENASVTSKYNSTSENWIDFLSYDEDGVPYIADHEAYENYLIFVASNQDLKTGPAFSNKGLNYGTSSEDTLFGASDQEYSAFNEYSWNNDCIEGNGCGLDDTGMTWDEYLESEEGSLLAEQLRLSTALTYLLDEENGESADYVYIRHGMRDRDTSFTIQTVLYYAFLSDDTITDVNFGFAWLQQHMGNYDVQEAFSYIDECLADAAQ